MEDKKRCSWCLKSKLYQDYHDNEWGVPVHDEGKHFEFLLLETMQAGLSWITILNRREGYRNAFDNFNPQAISKYDINRVERLMQDTGIIRNRLKIQAAICNAKKFIEIQDNSEFCSFDNYIWSFTDGQIIKNHWGNINEVPATTLLSDKISKDMKSRGFKFVGSITIYAYLQAIGIVNDHVVDCFRFINS